MFKAVVQMLLPALLAVCLVAPAAAQVITDTTPITDTAPITDSAPITDAAPADPAPASPGSEQAPTSPNTGAALPSGLFVAAWGVVAIGLIGGGVWLQRRSKPQ